MLLMKYYIMEKEVEHTNLILLVVFIDMLLCGTLQMAIREGKSTNEAVYVLYMRARMIR